ncbi:hypothetical protein BY996DRAFT_6410715 [Phakopsora pachyrhizi]|nr:hypothetical protein BY996DRAFT_6410715 [Phakopsora pachyrhizi]
MRTVLKTWFLGLAKKDDLKPTVATVNCDESPSLYLSSTSPMLQAAQQANSTSIIAPQGNNIIPMPHGSVHSAPGLIHQHLPANVPIDIPKIAQPLALENVFDSHQIANTLASLNTRSNYNFSQEAPSREQSLEPTNQHSPAPLTLSTCENVKDQFCFHKKLCCS